MEYVTLSNGVKMPILGYGVYQITKDECERCVMDALEVGYRHIDTAQAYFNEEEVGSAIRKSGVPREEVFLTTKVWLEHYGEENAYASVLESMRKSSKRITSILSCCISRSAMPMAHGGRWKSSMRRAEYAPSASPISTPTAWWNLQTSTAYARWSIKWKRILSISRRRRWNG